MAFDIVAFQFSFRRKGETPSVGRLQQLSPQLGEIERSLKRDKMFVLFVKDKGGPPLVADPHSIDNLVALRSETTHPSVEEQLSSFWLQCTQPLLHKSDISLIISARS